jgi:hypothetical protein
VFIRIGGLREGDREFDSAVGARVLATLPVGDRWSLVGGLGVVGFRDETWACKGSSTSSATAPSARPG